MISKSGLPYVPSPYPDEILGSWLARVFLHNGSGGWRPLLEEIGYGTKLQGQIFDLVDNDSRIDQLLAALGVSYEYALRNLTTVLFWCALSGSDKSTMPSIPSLPMSTSGGRNIKSITYLGISHARAQTRSRWHCSKCISEDIELGRQPYWRRTHQIPSVHYCTEHWVPLERSCYACGTSSSPAKKNGLEMLTLFCACGADRRRLPLSALVVPQLIKDLSRFCADTLKLETIDWTRRDVRAVLQEQLSSDTRFKRMSMRDVISSQLPDAQSGRYRVSIPTPGTRRQLDLMVESPFTTAPAYAMLFVILGLSLDASVVKFRNSKIENAPRPHSLLKRIPSGTPLTVPKARALLLEKMKIQSRPISQYGAVYWYLRIYDEKWLRGNFRSKLRDRIPSIEEDRRLLTQSLGTALKGTSAPGTAAAMIRSRLRDTVWLKDFKTGRKKAAIKRTRVALDAEASARRVAILKAIDAVIMSQARPERITYGLLGKHTGLTYLQAMLCVRSDPDLLAALAQANSTKIHRQLVWALRELIREQTSVSTVSVFRKASLPSTPQTLPFVRQLIEEMRQK